MSDAWKWTVMTDTAKAITLESDGSSLKGRFAIIVLYPDKPGTVRRFATRKALDAAFKTSVKNETEKTVFVVDIARTETVTKRYERRVKRMR